MSASADDIVLMAPTATAMRQLLAVCDEFAVKFDVMFNASKSKCMLFRPRKTYKYAAMRTPDLFIGGNNLNLLWSPYVIGQTIIFSSCFFLLLSSSSFMVALCNRETIYIFILFLSSFFFLA